MTKPLTMGAGSYFRFVDDNKMKYNILSVIRRLTGQAVSQQPAGTI